MAEKLTARDRADLQKVARVLLDMPIKRGVLKDLNETECLEELSKANLEGKARIFLIQMNEALKGNQKAAEFCFKYAGLEPVKENHVVMDVPQIIDDMARTAVPSAPEAVKEIEEEIILYDDPAESQ